MGKLYRSLLSEEAQSLRCQAVAIVIVDCYCWGKMCLTVCGAKITTNMMHAGTFNNLVYQEARPVRGQVVAIVVVAIH